MNKMHGLNEILDLPLRLLENLPGAAEKEVKATIRALKTDGNLAERVAAANTLEELALKDRLGYRGPRLACDALLQVFENSPGVEFAPLRAAVISALSPDRFPRLFSHDERVDRALMATLHLQRDEDPKVRECCARGLALCTKPIALQVLLRASEDEGPVGHAAANSLKLTLSDTREPEVVKFGFVMAREMMERPGSDPYILRLANILAYAQEASLAHEPISLISPNRPVEHQIRGQVIRSCLDSIKENRRRLEQVGGYSEGWDQLINQLGHLYVEVDSLIEHVGRKKQADGTKALLNIDEMTLMITAQQALEDMKELFGPEQLEAMTHANQSISYSGNLPPLPSLG